MSQYDNDKLLQLAQELLPDEPSLVEEIKLAVSSPQEYVNQFKTRLRYRSIYKPKPDLPYIALLDGLIERYYLAEVDWKCEAEDVMWNIDNILARKEVEPEQWKRWDWAEGAEWDEVATGDFIKAAAKWLLERGLVLTTFNLSSDSYPLIVVPVSEFDKLKELTKQTGYGKLEDWSR